MNENRNSVLYHHWGKYNNKQLGFLFVLQTFNKQNEINCQIVQSLKSY